MDTESRSEGTPRKDIPKNPESSGTPSGAPKKDVGRSSEAGSDSSQPKGKDKIDSKRESTQDRRKRLDRAAKAQIITEELERAPTDSVRRSVQDRAKRLLESFGLSPKEIKKLSPQEIEKEIKTAAKSQMAGGAKIEDMPQQTLAEILKLTHHLEGQPKPVTPEVDRLLLEKARMEQEMIDNLSARRKQEAVVNLIAALPAEELREEPRESASDQETERVRQFGRRTEYQSPPLEAAPPPELDPEVKQGFREIIQHVNEAYEQHKNDPGNVLDQSLNDAGKSDLIHIVDDGDFLPTVEIRQVLEDQITDRSTAEEIRDFQRKFGDVFIHAKNRMNHLIDEYEGKYKQDKDQRYNLDDIMLGSQQAQSRLRAFGRSEADDFTNRTDLAHDSVGIGEEYRGVRKYLFERASTGLQGAVEEDFMASPADTPERMKDKLKRRIEVMNARKGTYQESDPTHVVDNFIRSVSQVDKPFGDELDKIFDVSNTLHNIEIIHQLGGGSLAEQQKNWTKIGQEKKTIFKTVGGQEVPEEIEVSDLGKVLDMYPGSAKAFGQFVVEAEKQLDDAEITISQFRMENPVFSPGFDKNGNRVIPSVDLLKTRLGWTELLMSHSNESKEKAIRAVAETLGMDPDAQRETLEMAYRIYRLYTPGIFEKTWWFPTTKEKVSSKFDYVTLDNGSPYQIDQLQNPLGWMMKELRGNPIMIEEFKKRFGPEIFPHLKIATRMLRKMVGGFEPNYVESIKGVDKAREGRRGGDERPISFFEQTDKGRLLVVDDKGNALARNGKVEGTDDDWRARLEKITTADWRDDVLDDSIKELEFLRQLQPHFQIMDDGSLEALLKALPSGKQSRWQGALNVKDIVRHYIEIRRKHDKDIYDREDDLTTIQGERTINKMVGKGLLNKNDGKKLKHELFGIGTGSLRLPGYAPVRFTRKIAEGAWGTAEKPETWLLLIGGFLGAGFTQLKKQIGEQFKDFK